MLEFINLFKKFFPFVIVGVGSGLTVYYYLKFMPNLEINIIPRWINEKAGYVILRIEIKNNSHVRVKKEIALIQLLEHNFPETGLLSEWVPFAKNKILKEEYPIRWNKPTEILKTTRWIDAGESITVERFIYFNPTNILHVGLQFKAKVNLIDRMVNRVRQRRLSWTSTSIVISSKTNN